MDEIKAQTDSKQEFTRKVKQILVKYFEDKKEIKVAYLYGSFVTGRGFTDSDIDIALLTEPYKERMESHKVRVQYQAEISRLLRRDIDLVFLQEVGEILAFQVMSEGQVVFERNRAEHRTFRAYRLVQCLDFKFLENRMQKGMIAAMRRNVIGQ